MTATSTPGWKQPKLLEPNAAIRELQKLLKERTGHLIDQKDLRSLLDNHWSKLSFLAHSYHHEDVDQ